MPAPSAKQTSPPKILWRLLRNRTLAGFKFRRQHPVGPFFVDFYCAERQLVVEVDGSQHLDARTYDERRTRILEAHGLTVIRVWNHDVLARTDLVLAAITSALAAPHPPFGHLLPASGEKDSID